MLSGVGLAFWGRCGSASDFALGRCLACCGSDVFLLRRALKAREEPQQTTRNPTKQGLNLARPNSQEASAEETRSHGRRARKPQAAKAILSPMRGQRDGTGQSHNITESNRSKRCCGSEHGFGCDLDHDFPARLLGLGLDLAGLPGGRRFPSQNNKHSRLQCVTGHW